MSDDVHVEQVWHISEEAKREYAPEPLQVEVALSRLRRILDALVLEDGADARGFLVGIVKDWEGARRELAAPVNEAAAKAYALLGASDA